jgi:lycopene beta-cyclase
MMFDYAIVGLGAAGAQLALAMSKSHYFENKRILIIEKEDSITIDKRWSFWEKGTGKFDSLVFSKWDYGKFIGPTGKEKEFSLAPYSYKSINSKDFFKHCAKELKKHPSFTLLHDNIEHIKKNGNSYSLKGLEKEYNCRVCFDSRIDDSFIKDTKKSVLLWQHFKGWHITCDKDVFDPDLFVMMDFRYRHADTSFIYVLPYSTNEALIECTAFTADLYADDQHYESLIKQYISDLNISDYEILEIEKGKIPMSDYPFHKSSSGNLMKIGTAGSWVRPSTGYSFHYISKYVDKIIDAIKTDSLSRLNLLSRKTRWLDSILLEVLDKENEIGPDIFADMYSKNSIQQIFSFLDGETSIKEDLQIIKSFDKLPFLKGLMRYMFR